MWTWQSRSAQTYGTKMVAVTLRRSISASDNEWSAMLYTGGKPYFSRQYMIRLVDRVGGGDSFTAGLLYGVMNDYGPQETIEYAAAASCLKQTMEMDFNLSTADEVKRLVAGDGSRAGAEISWNRNLKAPRPLRRAMVWGPYNMLN